MADKNMDATPEKAGGIPQNGSEPDNRLPVASVDSDDAIDRALAAETAVPPAPSSTQLQTDTRHPHVGSGAESSTSQPNADSDSSSDSDSDSSSSSTSESDSHVRPVGRQEEEDDDEAEVPHTRNEVVEIPIPTLPAGFSMTPATPIETIGSIVRVGDRAVVIKAATSGSYRILDEGTIFCMPDRTVIGVLFEVFGPVKSPFYVVRFATDAELDPFRNSEGSPALYVVPSSHFVLTETLRVKGSDASNFHDEEVPLEDQEFSDDEQEALAKASRKRKRRASSIAVAETSRRSPNLVPPQRQRVNQLGTVPGPAAQVAPHQRQSSSPRQDASAPRDGGMLGAWYAYAQRFFGGQAPPPY